MGMNEWSEAEFLMVLIPMWVLAGMAAPVLIRGLYVSIRDKLTKEK